MSKSLVLLLMVSFLLPDFAWALRPMTSHSGLEEAFGTGGETIAGLEEVVLQSGAEQAIRAIEPTNTPASLGMSGFDPDVALSWFMTRIIHPTGPTNVDVSSTQWREDLGEFNSAHSQWRRELVYYADRMSACCYGHPIRWGFNYIHEPSGTRIQLGQDEVVTFWKMTGSEAFYSEGERDAALSGYRGQIQNANDEVPFLQGSLATLGEHLGNLLSSGAFPDELDQAKLRALAKIASTDGYYNRIQVLDQHIVRGDATIPITAADIERFLIGASELAVEGRIALDYTRILPTELQRLRRDIAIAVRLAQTGDSSGWDRIAQRYSLLVGNLSVNSIKVASFLRFAAVVGSGQIDEGKTPAELNNWGFFAEGPAIEARALHQIRDPMNQAGIDVLGARLHGFDFSQPMIDAGQEAVADLSPPLNHTATRADILNEPLPVGDDTLDVAETGLMGTIGEEVNRHGVSKKIHLLLELNRVIDSGGYLILDVKNKPLPAGFQEVLEKHFGFRVVTQPIENLSYSETILRQITNGNAKKAEKLKSHLRGASVVIAVKVQTVQRETVFENDDGIAEALRYDDSYEAQIRRDVALGITTQPEEVDLSGLRYGEVSVGAMVASERAARQTVPKQAILEQHPDFNEQLELLDRYFLLLPRRTVNGRGPLQDEVERLLNLWQDPAERTFNEADANWLREIYQQEIFVRMNRPVPVLRMLEIFPNLPHQAQQVTNAISFFDLERNTAERFQGAVSSGRPSLSIAQTEGHLSRVRRHLGLDFETAQTRYAEQFRPQAATPEMVPISLGGHLCCIVATAEDPSERNRALGLLNRASTESNQWLPGELEWVQSHFHLAMERDAAWQDERMAIEAKGLGRRVWSIRNLATLIQSRQSSDSPLDPATLAQDGFVGAVNRFREIPGLGWDHALLIAGLSWEEISEIHRLAHRRGVQSWQEAHGRQSWPESTISNLVWERYVSGESLVPGTVSSDGAQGAVVAARKTHGSWPAAVAHYLSVTVQQAEEIIEEGRKRIAQATTQKTATTKGNTVWTESNIRTTVTERHQAGSWMFPKALLDDGVGHAVAPAAEIWGSWPAAVADILEVPLSDAISLIDGHREEAIRAKVERMRQNAWKWNPGAMGDIIRTRRANGQSLLPWAVARDGKRTGIVQAAEREWGSWPEAVAENLSISLESTNEILRQHNLERLQEIAKQRGDRTWPKETIRREILSRHGARRSLTTTALDADGLASMVQAMRREWDNHPSALADILGMTAKQIDTLLEEQRKAIFRAKRAKTNAARGNQVWNEETLGQLIRGRQGRGEPLYPGVAATGARKAMNRIWGSWEDGVAAILGMPKPDVVALLKKQRGEARRKSVETKRQTAEGDTTSRSTSTPPVRKSRSSQPKPAAPSGSIAVYRNVPLQGGLITGQQTPVEHVGNVRKEHFQGPEFQEASNVVLDGLDASKNGDFAYFSVGRYPYRTTARYRKGMKMRISLIPGTVVPIAAFEADSGDQIFSSDNMMQVFLLPDFRAGFIVEDKPMYRPVQQLRRSLLQEDEVAAVATIGVKNVPAKSSKGSVLFNAFRVTHETTLDPEQIPQDLKVSLKIGVGSGSVLEAYSGVSGDPITFTVLGGLEELMDEPFETSQAKEQIASAGFAQVRGGYLVRPDLFDLPSRLILQGGLEEPVGMPQGSKVIWANEETVSGMLDFVKQIGITSTDAFLFNGNRFTRTQAMAVLPATHPVPAAALISPELRPSAEEVAIILHISRQTGTIYVANIQRFTAADGQAYLFIQIQA